MEALEQQLLYRSTSIDLDEDDIETISSIITLPSIPPNDRLKKIGEGGQADVYLTLTTDRIFVIKDVAVETPKEALAVLAEIIIMNELRHPRILGISSLSMDYPANTIEMGLEYCPVDLSVIIGKSDISFRNALIERRSRVDYNLPYILRDKYSDQLIEGIAFIHSKGYVHLDIKPANILITIENNIKIADFGLSVKVGREVPASGSFNYLSPEMVYLWLQDEIIKTSKSIDLWAVGITILEIFTGVNPMDDAKQIHYADSMELFSRLFGSSVLEKLYNGIKHQPINYLDLLLDSKVDSERARQIKGLLQIEPEKRHI